LEKLGLGGIEPTAALLAANRQIGREEAGGA
jgi:hypothetical protein